MVYMYSEGGHAEVTASKLPHNNNQDDVRWSSLVVGAASFEGVLGSETQSTRKTLSPTLEITSIVMEHGMVNMLVWLFLITCTWTAWRGWSLFLFSFWYHIDY